MTIKKIEQAKKTKPFLRWAGGKKWLLKELDKLGIKYKIVTE